MPHHCYLHTQLLCNSIKIIYCQWGRDTFYWGYNSRWPNSYISICTRHSTINQIPAWIYQFKRNEVLADDFSVAGNLSSIKDYWGKLTVIGPKYGYFLKPTKSYLITKEKNWRIIEYSEKYVKDLVKDWDKQLTILSTIAETQPQTAYSAFASGFKSKVNYFLKTVPNIHHLLLLQKDRFETSLS